MVTNVSHSVRLIMERRQISRLLDVVGVSRTLQLMTAAQAPLNCAVVIVAL